MESVGVGQGSGNESLRETVGPETGINAAWCCSGKMDRYSFETGLFFGRESAMVRERKLDPLCLLSGTTNMQGNGEMS